MSAPSFTRSLSLAGQGGIARSLFRTKCDSPSDAPATGSHRPNRLELQAVLAHAQARKGSSPHTSDEAPLVGLGLGLPAELFPPALRDVSARHAPIGARSTSYAQSPLREVTSVSPSPTMTLPSLGSPSRRESWPVDGDEADLSLPSTPINTPVELRLGKHLTRPSLYTMPPYANELGESKPLIGLGIDMGNEPIASTFLGPRIDPRRVMEDFAADPIVTPGELRKRNFPLTPGAPMHPAVAPGSSAGRYFPLTPGAPFCPTTPGQAASRDFPRTPGAPLHRQAQLSQGEAPSMPQQVSAAASQTILEGLLASWGASRLLSRCSSFGELSVAEDQIMGPIPLPTPAGW